MKTLTYGAATFLLLAAALWAFALGDPLHRSLGSATAAERAQHLEASGPFAFHPDSLAARRVLAEADGLHTPLPDGGGIVFTDWGTGNVAIRDLETDEVRVLTDDGALQEGGGFAYGFSVSPDGARIAYVWPVGDGAAVRVVDVESERVREVIPQRESLIWAQLEPGSWAPDGESLAATLYLRDGSRRIVLVPADGGEATTLRSFDWRAPGGLAFSPDGEWLAYDVPREQNSPIRDMRLLSSDGWGEVPLLEGPTNHRVVGWLPGGDRFFYLEGDPSRVSLMAAELRDGEFRDSPREVRPDLRDPWPRGFTRDAFFYVQMPERRQAHIAPLDAAAGEITGPLSPIDPGRSMDWPLNMAWSPDGDRVAYIAEAAGEGSTLVVRSLATGAERTLPVPFNEQFTRIEWSPTEDRLVVGGTDNRQRAGVHLLDLSDGTVELLLRTEREGPFYLHPRWSRDGDALYVTRRDEPGSSESILRVDLAEGAEEVAFDGALEGSALPPVEAIAVSPDERLLAVAYGVGPEATRAEVESSHFRVLLVALGDGDGEAREVLRLERPEDPAGNAFADLDWTPDGEHLVVGTPWRELWVAPRDGEEARKLEGTTGTRPRVRPDGRELSVVAGENRWEIWALEGLASGRLIGEAPDGPGGDR